MKDIGFNQFKDADGKGIYKDVEKVIYSKDDDMGVADFRDTKKDPFFFDINKEIASLEAEISELEAGNYDGDMFQESDADLDDVEGGATVDEEGDVDVISSTPDEDLGDEEEVPEVGSITVDLPDDVNPEDVTVNIDGEEYSVGDEDLPLEVNTGVEDIDAPELSVDLPDDVDPSDVSVSIDGKDYVIDPDSIEDVEDEEEDIVDEDEDLADEDEELADEDLEDADELADEAEDLTDEVEDMAEVMSRYGLGGNSLSETLSKYGLSEGDAEEVEDNEDADEDLEADEEESEIESEEDEDEAEELEAASDEEEEEAEEDEELEEGEAADDELEDVESEDEVEDELTDEEDSESDEDLEDEDLEGDEDVVAEDEVEEIEEAVSRINESLKMIKGHLNYKYGNKWKIYEDEMPEENIDVEEDELVGDDEVSDEDLDTYELELSDEIDDGSEEDEIIVDEEPVEGEGAVEEVVSSNGENSEDMDGEELTDVTEGMSAILAKYMGDGFVESEMTQLVDSYLNENDYSGYTTYGLNSGVATDLVGGPGYLRTGNPAHPTKTFTQMDDSKYYTNGLGDVKVAAGNSASRADMSDVTESLERILGKAGNAQPMHMYKSEGIMVHTDDTNNIVDKVADVTVHSNNLPIAENVSNWNTKSADKRLREVATRSEAGINLDFMKATHLYYINEGNSPDDYRFPIATIIEGKVYAVPQAIENAAELFASPLYASRFSNESLAAIRESIDFYMNKMGKETPWQNGTCINVTESTNLTMLTKQRVFKNPLKVAEMLLKEENKEKALNLLSE